MIKINDANIKLMFDSSVTFNNSIISGRFSMDEIRETAGFYEPIEFFGGGTVINSIDEEGDSTDYSTNGIITVDRKVPGITIRTVTTKIDEPSNYEYSSGEFENFTFFELDDRPLSNNLVCIQSYETGFYKNNKPNEEFDCSEVRQHMLIIPSPTSIFQRSVSGLIKFGNRLPIVEPMSLVKIQEGSMPIEKFVADTKKAYGKSLI